jgi:hypothetical protein
LKSTIMWPRMASSTAMMGLSSASARRANGGRRNGSRPYSNRVEERHPRGTIQPLSKLARETEVSGSLRSAPDATRFRCRQSCKGTHSPRNVDPTTSKPIVPVSRSSVRLQLCNSESAPHRSLGESCRKSSPWVAITLKARTDILHTFQAIRRRGGTNAGG